MNGFLTKVHEQVRSIWQGMNRTARMGLMAAVAAFLLVISLLLWRYGGTAGHAVLFSNLEVEDAAAVVAVLREAGVPYRLEQGGTQILVPADQVPALRLDLAAQGLPRGGVVGFEAFDTTRFGITDFERQVQYQRALQGELTRTIRAFEQVQDARVHITLPERSLFVRDQPRASASVVLQLRPGTTLSPSQVQAIVHLLAHSVEGLSPEDVTVVDTRGNVLTDLLADADTLRSDAVARRLDVERQFETRLARDVQAVLEQVYGIGKVIARVHAELNFDRFEETSEVFASPTGGPRGLPRSEQRTEERYEGELAQPGGVVGVDANIPGYVADAGTGGTYELFEETINYELNRTVTSRDVAPGAVRRLSVAVLIDGELEDAELARVSDVVAAAVGLDPARGDLISVQSLRFSGGALPVDAAPAEQVASGWLLPLVAVAALALGAAIVLVLRRRQKPVPAVVDLTVGALPEEEEEKPLSVYEQKKRQLRSRVQAIAKERPKDVAELLRAWMAEDR